MITPENWVVDDGVTDMEAQAEQLVSNVGTNRAWVAVGAYDDGEGFAEVVALCHPDNAAVIAVAPELLNALQFILDSEDTTLGDGGSILGDELRGIAQAAIAKAKGGGL